MALAHSILGSIAHVLSTQQFGDRTLWLNKLGEGQLQEVSQKCEGEVSCIRTSLYDVSVNKANKLLDR